MASWGLLKITQVIARLKHAMAEGDDDDGDDEMLISDDCGVDDNDADGDNDVGYCDYGS